MINKFLILILFLPTFVFANSSVYELQSSKKKVILKITVDGDQVHFNNGHQKIKQLKRTECIDKALIEFKNKFIFNKFCGADPILGKFTYQSEKGLKASYRWCVNESLEPLKLSKKIQECKK